MLKFSVVIPAYNSSSTIGRCLDSCFNQTHPPHEVVVVDDCSADTTAEVAGDLVTAGNSSHGVSGRIVKLPRNGGPSKARNHGWNMATGDYVAFLDADDVWHPRKLEIMNDILTAHPDIDLLGHGCALSLCSPAALQHPFSLRRVTFGKLLLKNFSATPCVVVRRSVEERFDTGMRYAEDHELWLRISSRHAVYTVPDVLTQLGRPPLSPGGLSANRLKMRLGEIRMYINAASYDKRVALLLPFLLIFTALKHVARGVRVIFSRRTTCQHAA